MNGRLQGPIDFWIRAGYGLDLSKSVSLEASLTHICQHLISVENPYILNLNELAAAIRVREGGAPKQLTDFRLIAGAYPSYSTHKLLVSGAFRLEFAKDENGRFFADLDFDAPVLTGDGFFAQFWPDRMIYSVRADYEKTLAGGLFAAWYARYDVDMPADKAVGFLASLSTGLALYNEPDFERLEKAIRFEVWGGVDFKYDYDVA